MLSIGSILQNRYRVDRMLDIGAMEARYRGWDLRHGEPVFIRELTPQPDLTAEVQESLLAAFSADATALIELDHPHIVRVLDAFIGSGVDARPGSQSQLTTYAYLIQQAIPGQTLTDLIAREGTIKEARVVNWAQDLLDALDYAHDRGVIHRDLRPDSILITPDDRAVLTNFEIVALWNSSDPRTWTAKRVMGVPQYAPPECWGMHASQVDARSDIYSLGATLYHALTGEQPLTAGERTSNPYRFLQVKALAPRVRSQTRAAIIKAMELPPGKRYPTAASMRRALSAEEHDNTPSPPVPAPFLPRRREVAWTRAGGLMLSTLVLFLAGFVGLWMNQNSVLAPLIDRATKAMGSVTGPTGEAPHATLEPTTALVELEVTASLEAPDTPLAVSSAPPVDPVSPILDSATIPVPNGWEKQVSDTFDNNANGWVASEFEDAWGRTGRIVAEGVYRWEIEAVQAVSRWCTPEYDGSAAIVSDFLVSVDAQRLDGPESAAYGLVLRHTLGSYYLFSVRDDGYFLFSLWTGFAWEPIVDWTQTTAVDPGAANRLAAKAEGDRFELYINGRLVQVTEDEQLTEGDAGLSISTAATNGEAAFVFDNFELWAP